MSNINTEQHRPSLKQAFARKVARPALYLVALTALCLSMVFVLLARDYTKTLESRAIGYYTGYLGSLLYFHENNFLENSLEHFRKSNDFTYVQIDSRYGGAVASSGSPEVATERKPDDVIEIFRVKDKIGTLSIWRGRSVLVNSLQLFFLFALFLLVLLPIVSVSLLNSRFIRHHVVRPLEILGKAMADRTTMNLPFKQGLMVSELTRLGETYELMRIDIEQKEVLERRLLKAEKMDALGTLTSRVAHDINNSLAVILGNLQMAKMRPDENEVFLERTEKAVENTGQMLQKIMNFASSTSDSSGAPTEALAEAIQSPSFVIAHPMVKYHIENRKALYIDGNLAVVTNMILNLVKNAFEAIGVDVGEVSVVFREADKADMEDFDIDSGDFIAVDVIDTGAGIDADIETRIFDPYFSTKLDNGGLGLGLWGVHHAVTSHGGYIQYFRMSDGRSRFTLLFPGNKNQVACEPAAGQDKQQAVQDGRNKKILVVEDHPHLLCSYIENLTELGCSFGAAATKAEAFKLIDEMEAIDLLVTDYDLPDGNGIEIVHYCHERHPAARKVVISGYLAHVDQESYKIIDRVLIKPVSLKSIVEAFL